MAKNGYFRCFYSIIPKHNLSKPLKRQALFAKNLQCISASLGLKKCNYVTHTNRINRASMPTAAESIQQDIGLNDLIDANLDFERQVLVTGWKTGEELLFPFVWLRDACQCPKCFCPKSISRISALCNMDPDIQPVKIHISSNGQNIFIQWQDNHVSEYETEWLYDRRFTTEAQQKRIGKWRPTQKLWGSELISNLPTVHYSQLMTDDSAIVDWLNCFEELGIHIIEGANEVKDLPRLVNKTASTRVTKYGEVMTLKIVEDPVSIAFTNHPVSLHNDFTFMEAPPGVFFLNCINQGINSGGRNLFVDGFKVAKQLQKENPSHFDILTRVNVDFCDISICDDSFILNARRQIIELDNDKKVKRITFSDHGRSVDINLDVEDIKPLYDAIDSLVKLFNKEENVLKFHLKEGDIVCMDNRRILHGREGFSMKGQRHMQGMYMDWDELRSTREVIQYNKKDL